MSKSRTAILGFKSQRHSRGFSMFELVLYIIISAFIYTNSIGRVAGFPSGAERANFLTVTTQIQSGVNLEMMGSIARGTYRELTRLEGTNPMDLLLEPPNNYLGAFGSVNVAELPRRSWYFDSGARQLVYLIDDTAGVYYLVNNAPIQTAEIRFEIVSKNSESNGSSGSGILMQPVRPYLWQRPDASQLQEFASG